MGFMDELKRLAHPYEDEDEFTEEIDEQEPEQEEPRPRRSASRREESSSYYSAPQSERRSSDNVVNINTTTQLQVVLVKPEKFEDASNIANHLRDKRTVVLNLESANKDVARRLVDFLSGAAYVQDGNLKRVSSDTFLITPCSVGLTGDLADEIENSSFTF